MKTVCLQDKCTGCMACADICQHGAVTIEDSIIAYNAVIDPTKCIACKACERVCQINYPLVKKEPILWQQDWAANLEIRKKSSSGGAAAVFEREFDRAGGYVCSCVFSEGCFIYRMCHREDEVQQFAGSKYVKSNPSGIYPQVKEKLKQGKKVLFVGLPCHVAAVKNFVGSKLFERLYTIDLICHGTPSLKILTLFLKQHNTDIADVGDICFRNSNIYYLQCDQKPVAVKNCLDKYSMGFMYSLFHTESCYECHYADTQRISDITIGDSWGSELSEDDI